MAALTGTNGILTIANTTDTFTKGSGTGQCFSPTAVILTSSAASHAILTDADGVVLLDLFAAASGNNALDGHYFAGIRPWKTPIKCSTLTGGGKLRIYL